MLTGDTQRCTIFHQSGAIDIRHFGTAYALINPANHVAQQALCIVVQLLLNLLCTPATRLGDRQTQQLSNWQHLALRQFAVLSGNINPVVVNSMQGCCGWRRHPGAAGTGHRVRNFLLHHRGHLVGHRPHTLTNLCAPGQSTGQPDSDVAVFIGAYPAAGLDVSFTHKRTGVHAGMNLITCAIQKTGIDKNQPRACFKNAGLEV